MRQSFPEEFPRKEYEVDPGHPGIRQDAQGAGAPYQTKRGTTGRKRSLSNDQAHRRQWSAAELPSGGAPC